MLLLGAGIMDQVDAVTPQENDLYKDIDFDVTDYRKDIGADRLVHKEDKVKSTLTIN